MPPLPPPRPAPVARRFALPAALVMVVLSAGGCGKRGAPLAPLPRVPAAVTDLSVTRSDDVVTLTLVVPSANVSGDQPGDIAAIEVYAVTAAAAPELEPGRVPSSWTLVTTAPVRRPLPPLPANAPTELPAVPREPGLDQGQRTTFRERLTAELLVASTPAVPPAASTAEAATADAERLSLPPVFAEATQGLNRHYVVAAISRRGVRSAWSAIQGVPVGPVSGAPSAPAITYDAATLTLTWTPAPDARPGPAATAGELLESRPLGPVGAPTRYHVYAADTASADPAALTGAARLTEQPVAALTHGVSGVTFGRERCFVVRGVDTRDGVDVEGRSSPVACVTPVDTFAPPAPTSLAAVGGAGVVSLIWEGVDVADLAGYLVFRGVAGGEPTTQLTPEPTGASSFEDRTVTPGTRYVYVVVAVDSASPANRSDPSNRAEETARQ